ncbi:MAG TPA: PRC-barrel domain-containing protein [Pseudolabrys sp.]|nr:PRC-barrel domain-containing protein [Pseudolabrys sp.]
MKTLTVAALGLTLLAGTALAQSNPPPASKAPAATSAPAASSSSSSSSSTSTNKNEQNASAMNMWQGSKLIGLNVYDTQNEKIGDIKELMVDKDGKIEQVAIGVGGFLGMGEHDVAVKWTELKFSDQPVPSKTSSATGGAARTTGAASSSTSSSTSSSKKNYPDHATLNTTKDQLKAMPQFNYNK